MISEEGELFREEVAEFWCVSPCALAEPKTGHRSWLTIRRGVHGGSDKRSELGNWGYSYSLYIPYLMGSCKELLRVSQPSNS